MPMPPPSEHRYLLKFLVAAATFFFIGTVHGVLQVLQPIRAWLDSVGSPLTGPGHMIDPFVFVFFFVVGGLVFLGLVVCFFLFPVISGKSLWSRHLFFFFFWFV